MNPHSVPMTLTNDDEIEQSAPEQDDESGKVVALDEFRKK